MGFHRANRDLTANEAAKFLFKILKKEIKQFAKNLKRRGIRNLPTVQRPIEKFFLTINNLDHYLLLVPLHKHVKGEFMNLAVELIDAEEKRSTHKKFIRTLYDGHQIFMPNGR